MEQCNYTASAEADGPAGWITQFVSVMFIHMAFVGIKLKNFAFLRYWAEVASDLEVRFKAVHSPYVSKNSRTRSTTKFFTDRANVKAYVRRCP